MSVEQAVITFLFIVVLDIAASIVMGYLSRRFPHIRALRERRNISIAITIEIALIVFLAVWDRTQPQRIDPVIRTNVLILALSLPSLINAVWLARWVIAHLRPQPLVVDPTDPDTVRAELRHAIMNSITVDIANFYREHPEWLDDERSTAGIETLRAGMQRIVRLLDNYDIHPKP